MPLARVACVAPALAGGASVLGADKRGEELLKGRGADVLLLATAEGVKTYKR